MKICLAQTRSFKGEVQKNIENHLRMVKQAIASQASLIIFPELSLTGYEPELAKELAANIDAIARDFTTANIDPPSGTLEIYLAGDDLVARSAGTSLSNPTVARPRQQSDAER